MVLATVFFLNVIRPLSLTGFLGTSQGEAHPSWSQMLTPKVKPSFRLNFVGDTLSYWSHAQLVFCFLFFNKILDTWFIQRMQKGDFRWFGRAPGVLINHRKRSISSANGRFELQSNRRKGLDEQKESSCFRTSHVSNAAMIEVSNRRLARHDDRSWYRPKGSRFRRFILCTSSPNR